MKYICDKKRHLICLPYSLNNLHEMAKVLKISKKWFHYKVNGLCHYDIPKKRIDEIESKCKMVSSRYIVKIIRLQNKINKSHELRIEYAE